MKYPITKTLPERFRITVSVNVVLLRNSEYLLLRRANTGWADGCYTLPAGHLEKGESLTMAAIREAKEEIGVTIDLTFLKLIHVMHRSDKEDGQERLDFYFLAKQWQGEPYVAEPEKADQIGWYSTTNLPRDTLKNVRKMLGMYESSEPPILSELNW